MRIGANQRIALLLLTTGPAPSAGDLAGEVERQGHCGRDVAPKSVQRLMRAGLVRRLPGHGAPGSWGALALTEAGRRYLAHRRTWWERKYGAPERPEEWGRPRPLLVPSQREREEEPGPEPDLEPAAVGRVEEPRRRSRAPRLSEEAGIIAGAIEAGVRLAALRAFGKEALFTSSHPRAHDSVAVSRATVPQRCPGCGAPAGALSPVPPPRSDPGYRAVRCARCWGVFAR